jgi:carbon-monoxide dehydrogenase large subunit
MSADGNWKLVLSTPMGPQEMQMNVATAGDSFTGRIESQMGSEDVSGTVAGDKLAWDLAVTKPMPITLSFDMTVAGDAMTGSAKLGMFGSADCKGERI